MPSMEDVKSRFYNKQYKLTSDLVIARNAIEMVKRIIISSGVYNKATLQQYIFYYCYYC